MEQRLQKPAKDLPREKPGSHRGILDPANAARNFSLKRYWPSAGLEAFVEHYWVIRWDLRGREPYVSEVLPHPSVNVAFTQERAWITGVATGKYTYEVRDLGAVLGVMFRPGGFHPFLGRAVSTLTDKTMPASAVFPEATERFRVALMAQITDVEMVATVETVIAARQPAADGNIALVNAIIAAAKDDGSVLTVGALTRQFGMPERTLQHLFRTYVGVGLKWIIRRYRLIEAAELASTEAAPNWTSIAHALGYSDQAHFTNDFRRIVGRPPTDYAKWIARRTES